jgi:6-pyruvoyltetrahydropterin/6-carboxytetrahydropterin synthase
MYEISVSSRFSAAHHLEGHQGKCAATHGHNWEVDVYLRGPRLDAMGMLLDFQKLKAAVRDVLEGIDHSDLNAADALSGSNPSSENLARYLYRRLAAALNGRALRVHRVTVHETPETGATYWEERRTRASRPRKGSQ